MRIRLSFVIIIVSVLVFILSVYWVAQEWNHDCLEEYGKKYCESQNLTYDKAMTDVIAIKYLRMICRDNLDYNPREIKSEFFEKHFRYSEEEINDCIIKEPFKFRKNDRRKT